MRTSRHRSFILPLNYLFSLLLSFFIFTSCENEPVKSSIISADASAANKNIDAGPYEFAGSLIFDISATPDGSIMVGVNSFTEGRSIKLIKNGEIRDMVALDTETDIQGIESIGTGSAFFTTAGTDLAENGELYRASNGRVRMVADLGKFEQDNDPDAFAGPQWKNQQCEEEFDDEGRVVFTAGPQNNPYKVTAFDGETALVADAAGNTVLQATTEGEIDWKALLTPPLDANGNWMELFETTDGTEDITCYVQPVATSVAIGEDGYVYIGELTGATPSGLPTELSRVWKIPADGTNLICSALEGENDCHLLVDKLTSVIDLEIGPDGLLYVVEFDSNSWLSSVVPEIPWGGGTISAYNTETGELVKTVAEDLVYPGAITFDKKGKLWVLENKLFIGEAATISMLDY